MPTMSDEDAVEAPPEAKPDTDDDPSPPATGTSTGTGNDEEDDEMLEGFPSTGSSTDLTDDVGDAVVAVSEEAADGGDNAPSEDQPPQSQKESEMSPPPGTSSVSYTHLTLPTILRV